jgi:hypothetical protein
MVGLTARALTSGTMTATRGVAMMKNWVLLAEYASTVEAEIAAARLRDAGLHVLTNSPAPGVFGPGYSGSVVQGVRVLVPAEELEQARHTLDLEDD